MSERGSILLTGATGFLGMDVLARLLEEREESVTLLVRCDGPAAARERLGQTLSRLYDEVPEASERVRAIASDMLEPGLGLDPQDRSELIGSVDRIVHCAGSISFGLTLAQARAINVDGTARVIDLAREIAAAGRLERLVHVSTAYVCGERERCFSEHERDWPVSYFRTTYEQSKHEAELLVLAAEDLPTAIVRPSIVVGDRVSGWTPTFNVIYGPIRAFERGLLDRIPARGDSVVDLVPVDYVTDVVMGVLEEPGALGVYHAVAGEQALLVDEMLDLQAEALDRPRATLVDSIAQAGLPHGTDMLVPYFDVRHHFADERTVSLLEGAAVAKPDPRDYFGCLIAYAHRTAWGKRPISRQAALAARISS